MQRTYTTIMRRMRSKHSSVTNKHKVFSNAHATLVQCAWKTNTKRAQKRAQSRCSARIKRMQSVSEMRGTA
eukprot:3529288-Pleurochrysis_carterae.AAC.2